MKKVPVQRLRIFFRTAVLCAVLSGLLFSCGEGIRLIPFPAGETAKNDQSYKNFGDRISYQFSAPRFEDAHGNFKTQSQRNSQHHHHHWIANGAADNPSFSAALAGKNFQYSQLSADLKRLSFSESGESRAPPFIV